MRTADKMVEFCCKTFGSKSVSKKQDIKNFKVIENTLHQDEDVKFVFTGLHDFVSIKEHKGRYAYAITPNRILLSQKGWINEKLQVVNLDNLNDVTMHVGALMGSITFDTLKEVFRVSVSKDITPLVLEGIQNIVLKIKQPTQQIREQVAQVPIAIIADEILKLKQLMDDGIITEQEFNSKKAQLLSS